MFKLSSKSLPKHFASSPSGAATTATTAAPTSRGSFCSASCRCSRPILAKSCRSRSKGALFDSVVFESWEE